MGGCAWKGLYVRRTQLNRVTRTAGRLAGGRALAQFQVGLPGLPGLPSLLGLLGLHPPRAYWNGEL